MNQSEILETLTCFKDNRQRLILDFLCKDVDIFTPMFAYEDSSLLMEIAIERYFISWINQHFLSLEYLVKKLPDNEDEVIKIFLEKIMNLIQDYIEVKNSDLSQVNRNFINGLLEEKQKNLKLLLDIDKKSQERYNYLLLEYEKDKALFRRQLKILEE